MSTLTIPRDRLHADLLPGDRITAIDDTPLRRVAIVELPSVAVSFGGPRAVRLRNALDTDTDWNLYPDSQVADHVTVERDDAVIDERARDAITEMLDEQDGQAEGGRQETPGAPETPAQPKRRRTVRKTRYGLTMVSEGEGLRWRVEGHQGFGIIDTFAYETCEREHPVRERVYIDPYDPSKGTRIERGYHYGGEDHHKHIGYDIVGATELGLSDDLYYTVDQAWETLANAMRERGLL